jgi:hypothetical protein
MKPNPTSAPPEPLERARRQFERWRRLPKPDRRIPEALWRAAVEAAGCHGISKTALALSLSHQTLKERVEAIGPRPLTGAPGPAFVELLPPALVGAAECVVELEDRRGTRMRIQIRGTGTPDVTALTKTFLASKA